MQILPNTKTRLVLWNLTESQNMVFCAMKQNLPVLGTKPTFANETAVNHETRQQANW